MIKISGIFFQRQLGALLAQPAEARRLLQQLAIPVEVLQPGHPQQQAWFDAAKLAELGARVWTTLNDESAGVMQKPLRTGTFRLLCHAVITSSNLRRAMIRSCDFFKILSDEFDVRLSHAGDEARLSFNLKTPTQADGTPGQLPDYTDYFYTSTFVTLSRWYAWLIDQSIHLNRVEFSFPAFADEREYSNIFSAPVAFNGEENALVFPARYLEQPITRSVEELHHFLVDAPGCLITRYHKDESLTGKIQRYFSELDSPEQINAQTVAEYLNMSVTSLSRYLKKEGTSLMELKDNYRRNKAIKLLRVTHYSLAKIATQLGFSESSAFSLAFKKWTGKSPADIRTGNSLG